MIPILYETNETTFASNGIGRLRDCVSAVVTEERNGVYELQFEYPVNGARFEDIQVGRIVGVTHDESDDIQPFDIVSFERPIDGVVTFHCTHISYRQSYMTVTGSNINSLADAFTLLSSAEPDNPFSYDTDKDSTGYLASADGVPKTVRSMLGGIEGSILDAYGGEYEWDRFNVFLHSARGTHRNFSIRYGVNMLDYNEELDSSGTYMSCIPYWTDGTTTIVGDKQESGNTTITNRGECVPLDVSDKFENQPTKADVEAMGLSVMNAKNPTMPSQSIHVEFVRLQDMGYEGLENLYECKLCDTINVVFPFYGTAGQFKIVKTTWDVLLDRYESMELGDLQITLAEALGLTSGKEDSTTASEWTLITTVTGNVSTTVDLSDFAEVLVTCEATGTSLPRFASSSIPVAILSNNYQEWSIGYSSSVSTDNYGALFRLSLTNFTPQWAYAHSTDKSSTAVWRLYGLKVKNLVNGGGSGGVTGVKGANESVYRTGNVNLTAANIGALPADTAIHNVPSGGATGQVLTKNSGTDYDLKWESAGSGTISDVQVNGTSVVSGSVANIPTADASTFGVAKMNAVSGSPMEYYLEIDTASQYKVPLLDNNQRIKALYLPEATTSLKGAMSATDKTKLDGIATGAEVNVQSNWTEADSTSDAFILNKPTLATVATSGSYNDLSDKPTIPVLPVGSVYECTSNTNPSASLGGTWEYLGISEVIVPDELITSGGDMLVTSGGDVLITSGSVQETYKFERTA